MHRFIGYTKNIILLKSQWYKQLLQHMDAIQSNCVKSQVYRESISLHPLALVVNSILLRPSVASAAEFTSGNFIDMHPNRGSGTYLLVTCM